MNDKINFENYLMDARVLSELNWKLNWKKYEEPQYQLSKSLEKFVKKWLRMQKKNRRRWGQ